MVNSAIEGAGEGATEGEVKETLYLGDAIDFFLNAKRSGGRSQRTVEDYRKKLELFQRWLAARYGERQGSEEVSMRPTRT